MYGKGIIFVVFKDEKNTPNREINRGGGGRVIKIKNPNFTIWENAGLTGVRQLDV